MSIKIYKDAAVGLVYFEGSRLRPQPANQLSVSLHPTLTDRLVIKRLDQFRADGVTPRTKFSKLLYTRIRDVNGNAFADRNSALIYLQATFVLSAVTTNAEYQGIWTPTTNTPDIFTSVSGYVAGDFYRITEAGTHNAVTYNPGDVVIFNSVSSGWDKFADNTLKIADIESSAINEFDIVVDADYAGAIQTGSALQPYVSLATAIANSSQDNTILVKGTHIIASEISLPHGLEFIGAQKATIKYATYADTNGDLMEFDGTDNTQTFRFENIDFLNAGGYGLYIKKTLKTIIVDCKFTNNGWNGTALNTVVPAATFGLLGYDSTSADLQAFYAGSNASNGGAMRIQEATQVEIINNNVSNNLRGIRLQDCGVNGYGFVTRNVASQNIESGIYLAAGTLNGCQNIIVTINSSAYNANNGLLCIGGINNKFSQNEVNGNWNAGACFWGAANSTLRDCGLYDNNRSQYNGIGNTGDAKASI